MSQSQSIGWVKQKSDNNCQTIRIATKSIVQFFFSTQPICQMVEFNVGFNLVVSFF